MTDKIVCWGIDSATCEWIPTTLKVSLDCDSVIFNNGKEVKNIPLKDWLEKQSKSGWMILLHPWQPMSTGNLEDCLDRLQDTISVISAKFPGIILYGAERFPNETYKFQDTFWESIGYIDNKLVKKQIDYDMLLQKQAALQAAVKPSKAIPSRIEGLATAYDDKPLASLSRAVIAKLSKFYKLEGEKFNKSLTL